MSKRLTTEEFVKKARETHGDRYDYSKVEYVNSVTKVCIICPKHGEFWQVPSSHLSGCGCPKCSGCFMNLEYFIEKARKVHGDKYDYSKVNYVNTDTKVCIICPEHGEFWQTPDNHLQGRNCPKCGQARRNILKTSNTIAFTTKAREIHGDRYDYSKVEYINNRTKVCIICPEHGEFWQAPSDHLQGHGCPKCRYITVSEKISSTTEDFVRKAQKIHGNKYNYSKVEYKNNRTKVCIICPEHGEFWQAPDNHLQGQGCPVCRNVTISKLQTSNTKSFIEKAHKIHGKKYDYSKTDYVNQFTPVCIICPEHGEFWQIPKIHLRHGICPLCNESSLEREVRVLLDDNKIKFQTQFTFPELGTQKCDFFLPKQNAIIECQGLQHFENVEYFGGVKEFEKVKERDIRKYNILKKNGYQIIYYTHCQYDMFLTEKMVKTNEELLKYISEIN